MNDAYFSAFAALGGSIIGSLSGIVTTWLTLHAQERARRFGQTISRREALYGEFIDEASKLYSEALGQRLDDPAKFIRLYALVSKLRLFGSDKVIMKAEEVMGRILELYEAPKRDFHALITERHQRDIDLLKAFSETCRRDLSP